MGTTHRIYSLKRKDIPVQNVFEMMKKINSALCVGKKKKFQYHFHLTNPERLKKITEEYKILTPNLILSFKLKDSNQLNKILKSPSLYKKAYFFNHQNTNPEKAYTSYWIDINTKNQKFSLSISLPYTAGIEFSKIELAKILKFLVNKNLIFIVHREIDELSKIIIDLNSGKFNGGWLYNNGITISAWGNYTPRGSNQKRPADVKLSFEEKDYKKYRGYERMAVVFHTALNEYFSDPLYYVQGTIVSKFDSEILKHLSDIEFFDFKIPIHIDVESKSDFSFSDLDLESIEERNLTIDEFDWLDSNPNHGDNRLNLWLKNKEEYEFEIEISKQIDESYSSKIEELLGEKLEYLRIE